MSIRKVKKIMRPTFTKGQIVTLDKIFRGGYNVEVVEQTDGKLFTIVMDLDSRSTWSVMSYRLTPLNQTP